MRLYLDEHVPVALSSALAAHGVDCLTTQEAGNLGRSDEDQLAFAIQNGRPLSPLIARTSCCSLSSGKKRDALTRA